jgi:hypothetical protein
MLTNMVGGAVRAIDRDQLYAMIDESLHERLDELLERPGVDGAMVYQVLQMDSSRCGEIRVVMFGPYCAIKTAADAANSRLGDVPSRFAYATFVYVKPQALAA